MRNAKCEMSRGGLRLFVLVLAILVFLSSKVSAQGMESGEFQIDEGNVRVGSEEELIDGFGIATTFGSLESQEFKKKGYVLILAPESSQKRSIVITALRTSIVFENISPNSPIVEDSKIAITTSEALGYHLFLGSDGPLESHESAIIGTFCDGRGHFCTPQTAQEWKSPTAYGFGYRLEGKHAPSDFDRADTFRPFLPLQNEAAALYTTFGIADSEEHLDLKLKLVISSDQPVETYTATIRAIGLSGY